MWGPQGQPTPHPLLFSFPGPPGNPSPLPTGPTPTTGESLGPLCSERIEQPRAVLSLSEDLMSP